MDVNKSFSTVSIDWNEFYAKPLDAGLGNRLGVSFTQAQLKEICVKVKDIKISLCQCEMGVVGISGVVWDAGLFLVDYLSCSSTDQPLGHVLDLGCGTGVCGLSTYYLGATDITLSDMVLSATLEENIDDVLETTVTGAPKSGMESIATSNELSAMNPTNNVEEKKASIDSDMPTTVFSSVSPTEPAVQNQEPPPVRFVEYNWDSFEVPMELVGHFDTVLCSDVLYDEKFHAGFLRCLDRLTFTRCLLSYKRRHDVPEKKFFLELEAKNYIIREIDSTSVELKNISRPNMLSGLHIFLITRN